MRSTPTARRFSLLLAAGCLAVGGAAAQAGTRIDSVRSQSLDLPWASDTYSGSYAAVVGKEAVPTGLDWLELPGHESLITASSFTKVYMTADGFSRVRANDNIAVSLQSQRKDVDLSVLDVYRNDTPRAPAKESNSLTMTLLAFLGLSTAAISGLLIYAKNPISRKRKYRQNPGQPRKR